MPDCNWPARTAICLECRTTFSSTEDSPLHGHSHTLVSLHDEKQREHLLERVWGPLVQYQGGSRKRALMSVVLGGAALGGLGAVFVPMLGLGGPATAGAGLLVMLLAQTLRNTEYMLPDPNLYERLHDAPLLATPSPPRLAGSAAILATVNPGNTAPAPISAVAAVAFGVILGVGDHDHEKILRDGASLGFSLTTLEGDLIEIPPGNIEIISHGAPHPHQPERVEAYLDTLDPLRHSSDDEDPFAHEHAAEIVVRPGDHVAVHNPITRTSFATHGDYRQSARQIFAVEGIPCIELLP